MARFRKLKDGTIFVPKHGKPPPCPEGYERTNDPFMFHPIIKCQHLTVTYEKRSCCPDRIKRWCALHQKEILRNVCLECSHATCFPKDS